MANTVYGPYAPTTWVDGTTVGNQTRMNNIEKQASIGLNGFNGDLLTPFVLSGCVCTKDGTTATQLDVTAGRVYIQMTDGTVGLIVTAASVASEFLTATPSTTYYLDLNPDGSWSWGTSHSAVTHHLTICSVTTDASGNILAVTDARTLNTTLLSGMAGKLLVNAIGFTGGVGGVPAYIDYESGTNAMVFRSSESGGVAQGFVFQSWTGSTTSNPFSIGGQFAGALSWVDNSGNGYFTGSFVNMGTAVSGSYARIYWASPYIVVDTPQAGGANGTVFQTWDGSATHNPFSVGGQFAAAMSWVDDSGNYNGPAGGGVPTTRNGVASSVPIYTGTTTPSSPPTGSIWIKA